MSLSEIVRGRHLLEFTCVVCGPVHHRDEDEPGQALQVGEVLICSRCLFRIMFEDDTDGCPVCWPSTCPGDGFVSASPAEHRAHVKACHGVDVV